MKKQSKIWIITACSFVLFGLIIFGGAMAAMGWDFSKLSTNNYETNYYDIDVVPATLDTTTLSSPSKRLVMLDFPAFGLPNNAILTVSSSASV